MVGHLGAAWHHFNKFHNFGSTWHKNAELYLTGAIGASVAPLTYAHTVLAHFFWYRSGFVLSCYYYEFLNALICVLRESFFLRMQYILCKDVY